MHWAIDEHTSSGLAVLTELQQHVSAPAASAQAIDVVLTGHSTSNWALIVLVLTCGKRLSCKDHQLGYWAC